MKLLHLQTATLSSLLGLIEAEPGQYRYMFRGQTNAAWNLTPALYRMENISIHSDTLENSYDLFESRLIDRFFEEGQPYLPSGNRSYSGDRILAQHFGVPTRLLDWSLDPFVALFFAVESWQTSDDAAVFLLMPDAQYRPEEVTGLGPHKAIALIPPAFDRRIPAQKSIFTFHPYGPSNSAFVPLNLRADIGNQITTSTNTLERAFAKIIIPTQFKRRLFSTLLQLGIDRRNLFPGLDGVGSDVAIRARTGQIF